MICQRYFLSNWISISDLKHFALGRCDLRTRLYAWGSAAASSLDIIFLDWVFLSVILLGELLVHLFVLKIVGRILSHIDGLENLSLPVQTILAFGRIEHFIALTLSLLGSTRRSRPFHLAISILRILDRRRDNAWATTASPPSCPCEVTALKSQKSLSPKASTALRRCTYQQHF